MYQFHLVDCKGHDGRSAYPIIKQVNIKERRQKHLNSAQSIVNKIELNLAVRSDC